MTREEAVIRLTRFIEKHIMHRDLRESIEMAIEALKTQESYELKNELPNHFSNACDLCVHKNVMCNICMTADKWEPKEGE